VINKIDLVDPSAWLDLRERYQGLLCSAQDSEGLEELLIAVERQLFRQRAKTHSAAADISA
jgi:50S ribosomal subunit-associated GTPase HflX